MDHHGIFGAGPLGRYTAEFLVSQGHRVTIFCRSGTMPAPPAGVQVVALDALNETEGRKKVQGMQVLYQCAQPAYHRWAQEFPQLQTAVLNLAEAAGARLVAAENLYMYGKPQGKPLTEDTPWNPCSQKGTVRAKMAQELAEARNRLPVVQVRGSDFFGPWEPINSEMIFSKALAGKPMNFLGSMDQKHTFTYVKDFGRALGVAGIRSEAVGRVWHVPSGEPVTQREILESLEQILGKKLRGQAAGKGLLSVLGLFNPGAKEVVEMLYEFQEPFVMDSSAMEKTFGLQPTPMNQRLQETLDWVRSRNE